jgi:hypothetical protein
MHVNIHELSLGVTLLIMLFWDFSTIIVSPSTKPTSFSVTYGMLEPNYLGGYPDLSIY